MDLVERLKEHATGYEEWRVANPADGSYVISFSWSESSNPEREAREWLADHLGRNPDSWVKGYEVRKVMVQGERDLMLLAAAAEITRLRTRLELDESGVDGIQCRDETIRLQDMEIERQRDVCRARHDALAASQAREAKLRDAIHLLIESEGAPDCDDLAVIDDALALPADDSALRERLAAERERCAKVCEEMGAMDALEGEEIGSAAMVRVADRQADLCADAIRALGGE